MSNQGNSLTTKEAAQLMGKSEQFIRIGLQRNIFPFGYAVQLSSKWTYHISKHKLYDYLGIAHQADEAV